jgi:hypothetical protein
MQPILQRWDDAWALASVTARGNLSPVIADLQAIRREVQFAQIPECTKDANGLLIVAMNYGIDEYMAFIAQRLDSVVKDNESKYQSSFNQYTQAVKDLTK